MTAANETKRNAHQRDSWHDDIGDKASQSAPKGSIFQARPSKHVEIARSKPMPWIQCTIVCIEELVVDEHLIPCGDKVGIDIVCHLQVTIHPEEASERPVNGVVECKTVESILILGAQKVLVFRLCEIRCLQETGGKLCWGTATTSVKDIRHVEGQDVKDGSHKYKAPNVSPPVTSPAIRKFDLPKLVAH